MNKLKIIFSKKITFIILIILLTIPTLLPLTKPGFFPTQDFIHVARIYEMNKAIGEGQFPVRWISDFRYGEPLFNFYAPLPFYIGSVVHTLSFNFLDTTKILFAIGFILSSLAMFFLGKELFGKVGGVIAATLYLYAPYHSVDVYVRGAMSESLALIFFPLIFLASFKLSQKTSKINILFLSFSLAGLFFTHNIMTVLFAPFFIAWIVYLIWINKNWKLIKYFLVAILLGFGLASSFLLPAFLEKSYVQSDKLITGYFDYRGHFVEVRQFVMPSWGYGASLWGSEDGMSFQIGLAHLAILILSIVIAVIFKKKKSIIALTTFLTLEFLFSLFMQHNKSTPIWLQFPILAYTQFPWRFLGISIFFISLIGGSLGVFLKNKLVILAIVIILAVILINIQYFHPESYYYDSKDSHYTTDILSKDDKLPKDYLPIWVKAIMSERVMAPHALSGKVEAQDFQIEGSWAKFKIDVLEDSDIEIPITYFPGWQVFSNGKEVKLGESSNLGLIRVKLLKGQHSVTMNFSNTPVRTAGNLISILSLIVVLIIFFKRFKKIPHGN
ncbi:MAG: 6-pyruvoyl-tetrahydropterin synthase-related protein [Candidatus Daviesbacteria bacterium]